MKLGSLFDGAYIIEPDGRLFSVRRGRFVRPSKDRYGYLCYTISIGGVRKTLKAHRLVAQAYIPNPEAKATVNHINGVRDDNRVENLEWATAKEQMHDTRTRAAYLKRASETDYRAMSEKRNFGRKRTRIYLGNDFIGEYPSLREAAASAGVCYSKASECANGTRRHTGGVRFVYV